MAKNTDIRLSSGWYRHPKVIKLRRRLGGSAIASLLQLWTYTGEERPSGKLTEMDIEDIEIAAGWDGQLGRFVEELTDLRLLDLDDNTYAVHDWAQNNPWAFGADSRSEKARRAADARHGNLKTCSEHATSNATIETEQCSEHDKTEIEQCYEHDFFISSNAPSPSPSPSPSPVPIPLPAAAAVPVPPSPNSHPKPEAAAADKVRLNYFRASKSEIEEAKKAWRAANLPAEAFNHAIREVDRWLTNGDKTHKARASPSHVKYLQAPWILKHFRTQNAEHRETAYERKERITNETLEKAKRGEIRTAKEILGLSRDE